MRTNIIAKSLSLVALAVLTASCSNGNGETKATEVVVKPLVKTAAATMKVVDRTEEFTGTIQPLTENKISPSMGMRIDKINVEVGDKVRKGQTLVQMEKSQYLQSAVQLANLESDLARYQKLYDEGGVSKQQLDQMATQVSVTKHVVENLEENTVLLSPVEGVVTERIYDPGDVYSPSQGRILTVMQLNKVKVLVNVSETYFPQVKLGMPVEILLDVYPGEVFTGKVSLVHPSVDAATRTFTTEITIPNANTKLRPGMFSRVALNFGELERVVIPDIAVQKQMGSNERFVFVIENGVANRRIVNPGRVSDKSYEIISGLNSGEEVVIAGAQKLLDKTQVEISK